LGTKHFHGVSSGNRHPYWLKSQYGKVRFVLSVKPSLRRRGIHKLPLASVGLPVLW
jgi:hypothetical protein